MGKIGVNSDAEVHLPKDAWLAYGGAGGEAARAGGEGEVCRFTAISGRP
jgi:hypothetical protein